MVIRSDSDAGTDTEINYLLVSITIRSQVTIEPAGRPAVFLCLCLINNQSHLDDFCHIALNIDYNQD